MFKYLPYDFMSGQLVFEVLSRNIGDLPPVGRTGTAWGTGRTGVLELVKVRRQGQPPGATRTRGGDRKTRRIKVKNWNGL